MQARFNAWKASRAFSEVTPVLTFYWLPPQPGAHSMAGKFM